MGLNTQLMKQVSTIALTTALLAAGAGSAAAQALTVTDVDIAVASGVSTSIPSIEAVDANIDEAAIRALFAGDTEAFDLSTLDAASIVVPELTLRIEPPAAASDESAVIIHRDLELTGVTDGVATSAAIGSAEIEGANGGILKLGTLSTGLLDIGGILAFYGMGEPATSSAMVPLYQDFRFEGGTFSAPNVNCDIGAATVGEVRARPMRGSLADLIATAEQMEAAEAAGESPSPEDISTVVAYYVDFLTAFQSTPAELTSVACSGSDDSGTEFNLRVGPLVMGGFRPGIYPELAINDFRIAGVDKGHMEFDNFTWKPMDFTAPIAALEGANEPLDEAWFTANWRKLMPAIAGFSLTGLDFDVPDPENPSQRIVASIGNYDISLGDYRNGVPRTLSSRASGIEFPLPPNADTAALLALGIERLNLSSDLDLHWDEASETIAVDAFNLAAADLGSFSISGTVANATADLFSENVDTATAALTGLAVTELRIDLENSGILPILMTMAAADAGQTPQSLHAGVVALATAMPIGLLGATPDSIQVGTSIAAFLSGTPQLSLTITSKDGNGIGMAELAAAETDPTMLASKLNVTATVSGEPQELVFPTVPASGPTDAAPAPGASKLDNKQ